MGVQGDATGLVGRSGRGPSGDRSARAPRRWSPVVVAVALLGSLFAAPAATAAESPATVPAPSAPSSSLVAGGLGYVPLAAPCRAVDTRSTSYVLGAVSPDNLRPFQIAGAGSLASQGGALGGCGVPDGVAAAEVQKRIAALTATVAELLRPLPAAAAAQSSAVGRAHAEVA